MLPVQARHQAAAPGVPVSQVWNGTTREVQCVPVAVREDLDHVRIQQLMLFGDGPLERSDLGIGMDEGVDQVFQQARGQRNLIALEIHIGDRKSTRLNSSHGYISYAVFCLKKKK